MARRVQARIRARREPRDNGQRLQPHPHRNGQRAAFLGRVIAPEHQGPFLAIPEPDIRPQSPEIESIASSSESDENVEIAPPERRDLDNGAALNGRALYVRWADRGREALHRGDNVGLWNNLPRHLEQPVVAGGSTEREIRELRDQNNQLRQATIEVNRHFDNRVRDWTAERNRIVTRLRIQEREFVRTTDQVTALRESLRNQRRASEADRNHLRAHQQIARYGTHTHPIYPEVIDTDSDDEQPARQRPRQV